MASPRKTGKYGSLYLNVSATPDLAAVAKFADTFNARFETDVEMAECTRKGDGYKRFMPGPGSSRLVCQAHIQGRSALLALADDTLGALSSVPTALPNLVQCAFKLITLSTQAATTVLPAFVTGNTGQEAIAGYGWVSRGQIEIPFDQAIVEEFEIQVDSLWTFNATT